MVIVTKYVKHENGIEVLLGDKNPDDLTPIVKKITDIDKLITYAKNAGWI